MQYLILRKKKNYGYQIFHEVLLKKLQDIENTPKIRCVRNIVQRLSLLSKYIAMLPTCKNNVLKSLHQAQHRLIFDEINTNILMVLQTFIMCEMFPKKLVNFQ